MGLRDVDFMAMALDLARLGLGRTSPNPAVGAVIVKKGRVIATGFHKRAGLPHAEVEALTSPPAPLLTKERGAAGRRPGEVWRKSRRFVGATLFVTLEPCCPPKADGRTGPCTEAIIKSGIREVVVGMKDPDRHVSGRGIRFLKERGVRVRVGILRDECERLNEAYVRHRKRGVPFVTLKIASTLDGMVVFRRRRGKPRWITGPKARAFGHELRDRSDGILVGINTIEKDNPRLTTRLEGKKGKDPIRIVLDSSLRIRPGARVLKLRSASPTWIATTVRPNHPKVRLLERSGAEILFCKRSSDGRVDLKDLLKKLGRRGILNLLVEGGPQTWASFLDRRLADRIFLFLSPLFLREKLKILTCRSVGNDLMIEGRPVR